MPLSPMGRNLSGESDSGEFSPPFVHFVSRQPFYCILLDTFNVASDFKTAFNFQLYRRLTDLGLQLSIETEQDQKLES